jgi:peptide/nickel transport system permease protein
MATNVATDTLVLGELPVHREPILPLRWAQAFFKFAQRKPLGALGAIIIFFMIFMAICSLPATAAEPSRGLADNITGYTFDNQVLSDRLQGVSGHHILGTDNLGRDTFSRIFYGAKISITIGFLAVLISQTLAVFIGVISGYYGGKIDFLTQRVVDIMQALPGLIFLIFLYSVFGAGMYVLIPAIGILGAPGASRVVRGTVLSVRQNQYVEAAVMLGASDRRILFKHILPNIAHVVIIGASIGIGGAILIESTLAFLGFGLPPPFPTWGRMLNASREYTSYPMLALWPGLALTATVFAFNMLGDALRDVWDPRLRGSR